AHVNDAEALHRERILLSTELQDALTPGVPSPAATPMVSILTLPVVSSAARTGLTPTHSTAAATKVQTHALAFIFWPSQALHSPAPKMPAGTIPDNQTLVPGGLDDSRPEPHAL